MFQEKQQEIGDYVVGRTLGSGTTCKVKLAVRKETDHQVAIKIIKKTMFDSKPELQRKIRREVALMRLLNHPHLLKLEDFAESPKHLYIILEYAQNGELFDYLIKKRTLSVEQAMKFFREMIFAIEYLHTHAICHRDLKPENILLDKYNHIKIADFGFARWMKSNIADTSCGSPHYAAPEVIRGVQYDGRCADIWSLGVILFALLAGRLPFDDPSIRNLLGKVKAGKYRMPTLDEPIQDLISRLLVVDPATRITIDQIKNHPAFRLYTPEGYVFPKPLPIPLLVDPIQPSAVPPATFSALKSIGYSSDQEINEELLSPTHTMAKVFAHMLTNSIALEMLQWPSGIDMQSIPAEAFLVSPKDEHLGGTVSNDPFARRRYNPDTSSTPEVYSLVERTMGQWDDLNTAENEPQPFQISAIPIDVLMCGLQKALVEQLGCEYLHPDDMHIICRREISKEAFMFSAEYRNDDQLTLNMIPIKIDSKEFDVLIQQVGEVIQGIINQ